MNLAHAIADFQEHFQKRARSEYGLILCEWECVDGISIVASEITKRRIEDQECIPTKDTFLSQIKYTIVQLSS